MIFQTTQLAGLNRPKLSEMRLLHKSFLDIISPKKDHILAKLFDYKNFPNSAKAKAAAKENTDGAQKKEKSVNHRAAVYTRIASARMVEKSNHDASFKEELRLEGNHSTLTQGTPRCKTASNCRRSDGTVCTSQMWTLS